MLSKMSSSPLNTNLNIHIYKVSCHSVPIFDSLGLTGLTFEPGEKKVVLVCQIVKILAKIGL